MSHVKENKKVVGLQHDSLKSIPKVILKGTGKSAELIQQEFLKNSKPHQIVENKELVESLFRLPIDSVISPSLYQLMALILIHTYRVEAKMREENHD